MNKTEQSLVLELCRFLNPNREKIAALLSEPLDFPWVLGQILYNRMGGVAYYTLQKCGLLSKCSREFRNVLRSMYNSYAEQAESFVAAREELAAILQGLPFPYALLKGGLLCGRYPRGLRTSNDFDILIGARDISALSQRMKAGGFAQGSIRNEKFIPATRTEIVSSRMNRGETVPFIKPVDLPQMPFCEVDLNFSLDYKAKQETDAVARLLSGVCPRIQTGAGPIYTLCPADFLIHLCVHLYKEATVINWVEMGRDLSLYKFCDLYLLITEELDEALSWELTAKIEEYGLEKACAYALLHTRELFGIDSPALDRVLERIMPQDPRSLREILRPEDGRVFLYDMDFQDWLFCSNRKEHLYEAGADASPDDGQAHYLLRFGRVR